MSQKHQSKRVGPILKIRGPTNHKKRYMTYKSQKNCGSRMDKFFAIQSSSQSCEKLQKTKLLWTRSQENTSTATCKQKDSPNLTTWKNALLW